jgi:hypothetical protein
MHHPATSYFNFPYCEHNLVPFGYWGCKFKLTHVRMQKSGRICAFHARLKKMARGWAKLGGVEVKEAYTVDPVNIIFQRQSFAACCLSFYVGNVFHLHSICMLLVSYWPQASDVVETRSLVLATVLIYCAALCR